MTDKIFDLYNDKKISVIVPIYNEEDAIEENLKLLEEELLTYFKNYEVIVVSDGSSDRTHEEALKRVSPYLRVYHYSDNQGKGYALKYGFSKSSGDFIIFIDGGMELHPKDIKIFLALMDIYDADAVIGSKRHPQSELDYPWTRRVLSRIYQALVKKTLNLNVRDTQVGLKLFHRQVLEDSLCRVLLKKYAFDLELLTVANHLGYTKILEAPIKLEYKSGGITNRMTDLWRVKRMAWQMLWDTMAVIYRLRVLHYYDSPHPDKTVSSNQTGLSSKAISSHESYQPQTIN